MRRPGYYAAKITLTVALLAAGWVGFGLLGRSWYQLADRRLPGHRVHADRVPGPRRRTRQIFTTRRANGAVGFLHGNLLGGLSFGWWLDKHTARHHAHPRTEGSDTDIGDGVLAFTTAQARNGNTVLGRMLTCGQAWLFFPMLLPEGLNLHVASVRALLDGTRRRHPRPIEGAPLVAHAGAYLTALFLDTRPVRTSHARTAADVLRWSRLDATEGLSHDSVHAGLAPGDQTIGPNSDRIGAGYDCP